jgi:hemolysin D
MPPKIKSLFRRAAGEARNLYGRSRSFYRHYCNAEKREIAKEKLRQKLQQLKDKGFHHYQTRVPPEHRERVSILLNKLEWDAIYSRIEAMDLPIFLKGPESEIEFLPAALEIVETPPSPASRAIAATIILFFSIAVLWACIGSIDIIATAQGKVVPTGRTKVIQPLESGVVHAIHVQDGQQVKAGDVLIEIDTTITEAERDRLQKEYIEAQLSVARLKASLDLSGDPMAEFTAPEGASDAQIATERDFLSNQVQEIHSKLESLDQQISQQQGNLAAVQSTINKLTESMPYLEKKAAVREGLEKKGFGSKLEYYSTKQDLIEHQQELEVQRGRLVEAQGAVASLQNQREEAEAEYKHKNLDDLTQAEQKASSLKEQVVQASEKFRLQTLTAPVDGTVQQLAVHTEGGVVTPAQTLMEVVPADSHIEIEAMISNQDIGFVHAGQEAEVKVDTFNFTKYGLLHGHIISVSQDAITRDKPASKEDDKRQTGSESDSSEPKGQELVYSARIALDETRMDIDGDMVNLAPGMAVTAEIKTGSRKIIEYILSPIQKHVHQAMRER